MSPRSPESFVNAALPDGVWFHRPAGGGLECRPLVNAEADLYRLGAQELRRTLERRALGISLPSVCLLREWLRARLLGAALADRGDTVASTVQGARLVRALCATITGAAPPSDAGAVRHGWAEERAALWGHCNRTIPAPGLPEELAGVEYLGGSADVVWLAGRLMSLSVDGAYDMGSVPPLRGQIGHDVVHNAMYEPLRALIACGPGGGDRNMDVERRADFELAAELGATDEVRGTVSPYHPIRVRPLWGAESARVTVKIPAHIAETGVGDWHALWPTCDVGATISFMEDYPVPGLFSPASVDSDDHGWCALRDHPLVNAENNVCVADSAIVAGTQLTHRGAALGEIAAQVLLTIRDTILYGYHARHATTVYNRYPDTVPTRLYPRLLGRREARARARAENLEIIPWNR